MDTDQQIREHLISLLKGGNAFVPLIKALKDIPYEKAGEVPDGIPYSLWQQVEHLRIAQKDIVDFTKNDNYEKLKWPDDYWPSDPSPENERQFNGSVDACLQCVEDMIALVQDKSRDLLKPFDHGKGQTLFREAVLLAEHNAYHTGQIILIRRLLNIWE